MQIYQLKKQLVFTDEDGKQVSEQRARELEQLVACFQHHRPMGENSPISPKAALNMANVALAFFDARKEKLFREASKIDDCGQTTDAYNHRTGCRKMGTRMGAGHVCNGEPC